ncbi:hypothetical protein Tco_1432523 [Tanacetum coccineum]
MSFNLDNRRLDVFGTSVISGRHRVLCHLGFTFHYFRRRRSSRNRGTLISNTTSGGDTLQIFPRVSNGVTRKCSRTRSRSGIHFHELTQHILKIINSLRIRHSLQLAVEELELDEPELGKPVLDKPVLDKPEADFEHD